MAPLGAVGRNDLASRPTGPQGRPASSRELAAAINEAGGTAVALAADVSSRAEYHSVEAMSPFGRLGEPAEIAAVVAFLAGDAACWVTAQNIKVNGGTV